MDKEATSKKELMNVRISLVFLSVILLAKATFGGENPTFSFLRNDYGARAAALAGSFVSMTNDPNVIFYNPSALSTVERQQISVGFFKHLLDINSGHASYAQEIPGFGFVGAGIVYINYGEFTRTDETGNKLGTFSANELALSLGYADSPAPQVHYGANVKFIYSGIAEAASTAVAVDLGVLYAFPEQRITAGASLLNLGTQLDPYFSTRENLPLDLKVGATIEPEHLPLLLNVNFHGLNESQTSLIGHFRSFSLGGEFLVSDALRLRFGYDNDRRRDLKLGTSSGLAGFSFGGGVLVDMYTVDYAYTSYGKIGALHRISLAFSF